MVRISLAITAPVNLLAGYSLAFPNSAVGVLLDMPTPSHPIYTYLSGLMVALFGCAYGWLAMQPSLSRPLLFMGAAGKLGAGVIVNGLYLSGTFPLSLTLAISCDILISILWFYYLVDSRNTDR